MGDGSFVGGGNNNVAVDDNSTVSGGESNTSIGDYSTVSGGFCNKTLGNCSVIGGGFCNTSGIGGIINSTYNRTFTGNIPSSGGYGPFSPSSTLSGLGSGSTFSFYFSSPTTLSNVYVNQSGQGYVSGDTLTFNGLLFGGAVPQDNVTLQINTTNGGNNIAIGGGCRNISSANCSTIGGGRCNIINIDSCYSTISGGRQNTTYGCYSTISGGRCNEGGVRNGVSGVYNQTYTGGTLNGLFTNIQPTSTNSLYGFDATFNFQFFLGSLNNVTVNNRGNFYESNDLFFFDGSVFGGTPGIDDVTFNVNITTNNYATVAGGCQNTASGEYSTIGGGCCNTTYSDYATIGGGTCNTISTYSEYATIGGGDDNTIIGSEVATIAGGENNTITTNSTYATISGGYFNVVKSACATISGGYNNTASGYSSFVGGGQNNVSGINNFVSGIPGFTYTGGTLNSSYGSIVPTSTSSGTGSGAYFSFDFVLGVLQTVQIQNGGSGYSNGETLYFNGGLFGGSSPLDDVWLNIQTQNNTHATVSGGRQNTASGCYSTVSGGYDNTSSRYGSTIGGGIRNTSSENSSTVSGGYCNTSSGRYSTVSGGYNNTTSGNYSTIGGGRDNTSSGGCSTVSGACNLSENQLDTIGGGANNTTILSGGATGAATISGGLCNTSGNYYTFNGGGCNNKTFGEYSSIVGGQNNQNISGLVQQVSFVSGDTSAIPNNTYNVFPSNISGYGSGLQISFDVSGGSVSNVNVVNPGIRYEQGQQVLVSGDTIGGSSPANDLTFNLDSVIESHYSFIGGGSGNTTLSEYTFIGGGANNTSNGDYSTISGGRCNTSSGFCSTVSGGYRNTSSGNSSTISGGYGNITNAIYSTVSGGLYNTASGCYSTISGGGSSSGYSGHLASGIFSVIGGGNRNTSSGVYSTVSGGRTNTSGGDVSTVGGGNNNTATGSNSTISGGYCNTSINGCSAILGGQSNTAQHDCSFIVGSGIFSTAANTTHMNCLNLKNIPVDPAPATLPLGTVYRCSTDSNRLYICV